MATTQQVAYNHLVYKIKMMRDAADQAEKLLVEEQSYCQSAVRIQEAADQCKFDNFLFQVFDCLDQEVSK